ncbi:MAG: YgiQ family radical SAM protein [Clostridia bacterium]|nr:YgiQ family radical SAM protein [Clostridia bacterium]
MSNQGFLPVCREDMDRMNIKQLDFVYVSGDAYIDHPSFGHAIISRVLVSHGYTVGIIAQPDWRDISEFKKLGKPKYAFLVSAGNIDSMVNRYTVNKRTRSEDAYSPGGKAGLRPDRATIVYCNKIREAYPGIPMIIGGVEASLRRFAHYDYWDNKVRRSILLDTRANVLIYGMGEKAIVELADAMSKGKNLSDTNVDGCCYVRKSLDNAGDWIEIPSCEDVQESKRKYAEATKLQFDNQDPIRSKALVQKHYDRYLVQNKPMMPLTTKELDSVYALPYMRTWHPMYDEAGGVPAIEEVKFSITNTRGCYGQCNFCALTFHQGRIVQTRSEKSVINEAKKMVWDPEFKGYIHDVGGPTANFCGPGCDKQLEKGTCKDKRCLYPKPCPALKISHRDYSDLLRKLRAIPGIKKVFVRSGIRYDYLVADKDDEFFRELLEHHVSGQLKVAPEHISDNVLKHMGKPGRKVYDRFSEKFYKINEQLGKKQFLVPYLMSSHPGSTLNDAIELALYIKKHNLHPEQVQDFYPTPFTISTCMFYTGLDPFTMKEVYVPRDMEEKRMQRALLQFRVPDNIPLVIKALKKAGREDLIGYSPECLVRPIRDKYTTGGRKNVSDSGRKKGVPKSKGPAKGKGVRAKNKRY